MMLTVSPEYICSSALQSQKRSESLYYSPGLACSKKMRNVDFLFHLTSTLLIYRNKHN